MMAFWEVWRLSFLSPPAGGAVLLWLEPESGSEPVVCGFKNPELATCVCIMASHLPWLLPLMSDARCHFQEKQQSEYEGLTGDLKAEQNIYAHLAKTQDTDR
jgi:hypothetical protein